MACGWTGAMIAKAVTQKTLVNAKKAECDGRRDRQTVSYSHMLATKNLSIKYCAQRFDYNECLPSLK